MFLSSLNSIIFPADSTSWYQWFRFHQTPDESLLCHPAGLHAGPPIKMIYDQDGASGLDSAPPESSPSGSDLKQLISIGKTPGAQRRSSLRWEHQWSSFIQLWWILSHTAGYFMYLHPLWSGGGFLLVDWRVLTLEGASV